MSLVTSGCSSRLQVARDDSSRIRLPTATATTDTPASNARIPRVIELDVLKALGVDLPKTARILDFGCGAGRTIKSLRALGYANAYGYDVGDGRTLLGVERDRVCVGSLLNLRLPYEDNSFDLVVSDQVFEHVQDQVRVFQELCADHQARRSRHAPDSGALHADRGAHLRAVRRRDPASLVVQAVGATRNPQPVPGGTRRPTRSPITMRTLSPTPRAISRLPAIA